MQTYRWNRPSFVFALGLAVTCGCQGVADKSPPTSKDAVGSVRVLIQAGSDEHQKELTAAWRDGTTVLDALLALKEQGVDVQHRGSGKTAFVEAVDGIENSGSGANWLYYVNKQKAEQSCGSYKLQAGDVVLWKYTEEK